MRHILPAFGLLLLSGCASLGRYPGQTDVACIRAQMAPPENLMFDMAVSACVAPVGGQPLTGYGAHMPPVNLHDAPDLQAQARAVGITYTE